jgi:small subunit ribosomal protein S9
LYFLGQIFINELPAIEYVRGDMTLIGRIMLPFVATNTLGQYDVHAYSSGGGLSGQVGAIRYSISKALQDNDPNHRAALKSEGFLRRDARIVERKKFGRYKARKSYTFKQR